MTNAATKNEIIRRFYSGQSMRGIARELHVSRKTVRRVVDEHERDRKDGADTSDLPSPRKRRGSQVDEYEDTEPNDPAKHRSQNPRPTEQCTTRRES